MSLSAMEKELGFRRYSDKCDKLGISAMVKLGLCLNMGLLGLFIYQFNTLFVANYRTNEFLASRADAGICHIVPRASSEQRKLDMYGNWAGSKQFKPPKVIFSFEFNNFYENAPQKYTDFIKRFTDAATELGAVALSTGCVFCLLLAKINFAIL